MTKGAQGEARADSRTEDLRRVEAAIAARGPGRMVPDRSRILALLDLLGNPQKAYTAVHLTGTNGKTSTSAMVDSLLRAHGLRVGRYTSPHLSSVRERVRLDGAPLAPEAFVAAYDDVAPYAALVDAQGPESVTYFELLTALALAAFADAPVDAAVVEVGLGGEWDATNVLDAHVAVVTPIDLDHTDLLGPSVADIAREKAGIIAPGAVAVLAGQPPAAADALMRRVAEVGATVAREGMEFGVQEHRVAMGGQVLRLQGLGAVYEDVFLPLVGAHQAQNAAVALAAVEAFLGAGRDRALDVDLVRQGFADVRSPGRMEVVRRSPTVIVDAAHNPHGMRATAAAVAEAYAFRRLVVVLAVLGDKDVQGMLEAIEPVADAVMVTGNASGRALPVDELAAAASAVLGEDRVVVVPRLDDAIDRAVTLVDSDPDASLGGGGVLVTGSVVTAGEARLLLTGEEAP